MFAFTRNISILSKLFISFFIIFILFIGVSTYSLSKINSIKDLFVNLYQHPYTVSNTVRDINIHIISMHRYMKDIVLARNTTEMKRAIFLVAEHEEKVLNSFKIIEDRFLGDEQTVLTAKKAFQKWKPIREDIILNMQKGKFVKASNITSNKEYKYINSLQQKMKHLTDFATKKGLDYYIKVLKDVEEIYLFIVISLIFILLAGLLIIYFLTKYIKYELGNLQKGVLNFFKYLNKETNSITFLTSVSNDEIGQISQTINSNIKHTQTIIENEKKLQTELEKHQLQVIQLNKDLEIRVADEVNKNSIKEKLLFQQSKTAAMGEMIENIAHQWRQPLSVIATAVTGIQFKEELNQLKKEDINYAMDVVDTSVQHLSQTITDFRTFFIKDKIKKEFLLSNTFEKTFKLLSSQFKTSNISIIKNIEDITIVEMENELIQVFINIINNSRDELMKKTEGKRLIFIDIRKNNNFVEMSFRDNAGGIPNDVIKDIFNSHFTTKEDSSGTGIGLYMSKMIIEEHMKGKLLVENINFSYEDISYKGAEFKILLPFS